MVHFNTSLQTHSSISYVPVRSLILRVYILKLTCFSVLCGLRTQDKDCKNDTPNVQCLEGKRQTFLSISFDLSRFATFLLTTPSASIGPAGKVVSYRGKWIDPCFKIVG